METSKPPVAEGMAPKALLRRPAAGGARPVAKAHPKGKAGARPVPRMALGAPGMRRPALRREAKSLKDGGVVSLEEVKLDELRKDLHLVLEEASYFKTACKAAGRVRSIEAVGSDRYMRLHLTGTTNEDMLKVATAQPSSEFKVHLCVKGYVEDETGDLVIHATKCRMIQDLSAEEDWVVNLEAVRVPPPGDELAASLAKSAGGERYSLGGKRKGGGEFEQLVGKEQEEEKEIQEKEEERQKGEEKKVGKGQEGQARKDRGSQDPRWVNADGRFDEDPRGSVLRNGARSQGQSAAKSGKESPLVLGETEEGQKQFIRDIKHNQWDRERGGRPRGDEPFPGDGEVQGLVREVPGGFNPSLAGGYAGVFAPGDGCRSRSVRAQGISCDVCPSTAGQEGDGACPPGGPEPLHLPRPYHQGKPCESGRRYHTASQVLGIDYGRHSLVHCSTPGMHRSGKSWHIKQERGPDSAEGDIRRGQRERRSQGRRRKSRRRQEVRRSPADEVQEAEMSGLSLEDSGVEAVEDMRGEVSSGVVAPGEFKDSEKLGDWRFNAVPPNGSGRDPVFPISHSDRGAVGATDPKFLVEDEAPGSPQASGEKDCESEVEGLVPLRSLGSRVFARVSRSFTTP